MTKLSGPAYSLREPQLFLGDQFHYPEQRAMIPNKTRAQSNAPYELVPKRVNNT